MLTEDEREERQRLFIKAGKIYMRRNRDSFFRYKFKTQYPEMMKEIRELDKKTEPNKENIGANAC